MGPSCGPRLRFLKHVHPDLQRALGMPSHHSTKLIPSTKIANPFSLSRRRPLGFEPLEDRSLLSVSSISDSSSDPWDVDQAIMLAKADFHGADLKGKDGPFARVGYDLALVYEEKRLFDQATPTQTFIPSNDTIQ